MAEKVIADGAGLDPAGPADDQRYMNTAFVEKLFVAGMTDTVIGKEDYNRIVRDTLLVQTVQDMSYFVIGIYYGVQVCGPILTQDWMVGIIGRQFNLGRIDGMRHCCPTVFPAVQLNLAKNG